jgi:hypothetical protein
MKRKREEEEQHTLSQRELTTGSGLTSAALRVRNVLTQAGTVRCRKSQEGGRVADEGGISARDETGD